MTAPLLQVNNLTREYQMPREKLFGPPPTVKALNGVSFTIEAGAAWASWANRARANRRWRGWSWRWTSPPPAA
jgi:ABC-type antimicrobial peptide transport system ATPase subunit